MNARRARSIAPVAAALLCACSPSSAQERIDDAEVAALAPLKVRYPDVVMGFDIHPQTTLVVSLDLAHYIDMDDDDAAAMQHAALARWRSAWIASHPKAHAILHVRFIDFIGRSVATKSSRT